MSQLRVLHTRFTSVCRCNFVWRNIPRQQEDHPLLLCRQRAQQQQQRFFHPSRRKLQDTFPNHYATLDLPVSATAAEIKKQFYALSKKFHPDVNRDPSASERFVAISEAYHVLGSPDKKGKYDRDLQRAHATHHATRHGSHHSSSMRSGPAGGRPASGLSKRRSHFRGPPPSFYTQGGYGTQDGRRRRAQHEADAWSQRRSASGDPNHPGGLGSAPDYQGTGGFSPGNESGYYPDPNLPYFDKESHRRTHEGLDARRERMDGGNTGHRDPYAQQNSLITNFLVVSAVVATATMLATMVTGFVNSAGSHGAGRSRRRGDG
ncbi:uncharacterized protein PV09_03820 [Verruconis gallopava]|uniref:J domain-containing protein n=1 Tax=Verruconis gallopava TaxID=253628 RepID=A0A0D2AE76_9PEZI|nr:uncharacterized protein PV09_03820 [Verruconis gallopava]KIW05293.1 hypothetical protein PV09_03820 [Verruconis gallopava]